jgi:hypothetical protein
MVERGGEGVKEEGRNELRSYNPALEGSDPSAMTPP